MRRAIATVWEEDDYSVFKKMPENRSVTEQRKNTILASISEKEVLNPILVNEFNQIVEGQGRFEALRELQRPIKYIEVENATPEDCRRLNRANQNWKKQDYAESYSKAGNSNYTRLLAASKMTGLSITTVLIYSGCQSMLRNNVNRTTAGYNAFEEGKLVFTDEDVQEVQRVAGLVKEINDSLLNEGPQSKYFSRAVQIVITTPGYDHKRMIRNCEKLRSTFVLAGQLERQLKEFERIYNFRSKNGNLDFSSYMANKGSNVRDYTKTDRSGGKTVQTLSERGGTT